MDIDHSGHRERMRQRFLQHGLDGFADHEVLEFALFYAIPRKNTNALAHRLLRHFSSLTAVLNATPEQLRQIPEMTPGAIRLLQFLAQFYRRTRLEEHPLRRTTSLAELAEYFVEFYRGATHESVQVVLLDNAAHILRTVLLAEGARGTVRIPFDRLTEVVIANGASMFVLAHNHPDGDCTPSENDLQITRQLDELFRRLEHPLVEHILVAGSRYRLLCTELHQKKFADGECTESFRQATERKLKSGNPELFSKIFFGDSTTFS